MSTDVHLTYVTVGSKEEALKISRVVVKEHLAACANLLSGVTSIFEWGGKINEASEYIVLFKSPATGVSALRERIIELHSYDIPCVVSWPLSAGHPAFLDWVEVNARA